MAANPNLQDAISELVAKTRKGGGMLRVADAAVRLASENGGDCREIALEITKAGILARLTMELSTPDARPPLR
jgi:hypothetical protein